MWSPMLNILLRLLQMWLEEVGKGGGVEVEVGRGGGEEGAVAS